LLYQTTIGKNIRNVAETHHSSANFLIAVQQCKTLFSNFQYFLRRCNLIQKLELQQGAKSFNAVSIMTSARYARCSTFSGIKRKVE